MIIRTYQCLQCDQMFEVTLDTGNDADPPCPTCEKVLDWMPTRFAIRGNAAKAGDTAQQILNEDYQLSNFRDGGTREGDASALPPSPETTSDRETRMRQEMEIARTLGAQSANPPGMDNAIRGFWGGGSGGPPASTAQTFLAGAKANLAADPSANPLTMLHAAGKKGLLPPNYKIIARDSG